MGREKVSMRCLLTWKSYQEAVKIACAFIKETTLSPLTLQGNNICEVSLTYMGETDEVVHSYYLE